VLNGQKNQEQLVTRGIGFRLGVAVGFTYALVAWAAESTTSRSYSTEPLSDPIRGVAENTVEFVKFNNWLNGNYDSTSTENRQALKEHLYSIIDSHVKQLHDREEQLLPGDRDRFLSKCFAWATRMGVFGAHSVLERLDPDAAAVVAVTVSTPESFEIEMRSDMLMLSSSWGPWRAIFPYYFMVGDLRQFRAKNNLQTQLAIVSTGFGRHTADDGYSQATLTIVYSPEGTPKKFNRFWFEMFGLSPDDAAEKPVGAFATYQRLDASSNMHTELVFPNIEKGAMAVAYMGLAGTYEHNRQHFVDFVEALKLSSND
jgi:hypothetical protein